MTELDAAGITEPGLRADYEHCRALAAAHGRTYFLATRLLPVARRPAVHALYGFARTADEIVDTLDGDVNLADKERELAALAEDLRADAPADATVRALRDTTARYGIEPGLVGEFVDSMRMDLTVTGYRTHDELARYTRGSAAVIGLMMLPVLGTICPVEEAAPFAARLGVAFQLTNFIRDVGEDLRRGRVYLPQEAMDAFGVDRARLADGVVDASVRRWLAHEIAYTRESYRAAEPGLALLDPVARPCVHTAFVLYRDILAAVEAADYQVLERRVTVSKIRRARVALPDLGRAVTARTARARDRSAGRTSARAAPMSRA